jgi:hypothetical protein
MMVLLLRRLRNAIQVRAAGRPQRAKSDAVTHSRVDLGAVAPFVRRQRHHRLMDLGIDRQRAIERLFRPFPPQIEGEF